jgi:glycosyltransferase involved in cell wall biosynthesis
LLAAAARGPAPLIWHIHDFVGDRPLASRALRVCAWRADACIANSNAVADDACRVLPGLPTTVIHNAIDTATFAPSGELADLDALGGCERMARHVVRIGLVATYARWKGQDVFLEAARIAKSFSHLPECRFYIVGGPIYQTTSSQFTEEELRALTRKLGIAHLTTFVPFQACIERVYRALDVVVHASSRREPFGRTVVEAMATGKAVIVTMEGGARELFTDGKDAVGVPPRDPYALARAIGELATDPHRRNVLGAEARSSAVRRFSRERLARQVLAVYASSGQRCAQQCSPP